MFEPILLKARCFGSESLFSLNRLKDFFDLLLFGYFFTLHADQLSLPLGGITFRINNLLAIFLFFVLAIRLKKLSFSIPSKLWKALIFLTVSLLLSSLLSGHISRSLVFFVWYLITLIGYFFLPYLLLTYFSEHRVLKLYLLSFLLVALYGFLQFGVSLFGIVDPFVGQFFGSGNWSRPNAFTYEPSYLALYLTPFIAMVNGHFLLNKNADFILFRSLGKKELLSINLLYFATFATSTFFAFIILILAIALLPFTKLFPRAKAALKRFFLFFILASLACMVVMPSLSKEIFFKFFHGSFFTHHSFYERWIGIMNAFELFCRKPLFGVGLGNVPVYLFKAWREQDSGFYFILKEEEFFRAPNPLKFFEPSNVFTEILASVGIFGLLAFVYLFWGYAKKAKQALFSMELSQEKKQWVYLFFLSTIVMFLVLQFSQGIFRTYVWTHFGLAYALTVKSLKPTSLEREYL